MKTYILLLFLCCFGTQLSSAQKYAFKQFTTEEGLSHDFVNDIIQTSDGYLLIATRNGISKFNGSTFLDLSSNFGLNEQNINALFQDTKGRLWIGSENNGAYIFQNQKILKLNETQTPNFLNVVDFVEADDGTVYIIGSNGILAYGETVKSVIHFPKSDSYKIKPSQAILSDRKIYIATLDTGIICVSLPEGELSFIDDPEKNNLTFSIVKDNENNIWVGAQGELLKIEGQCVVSRFFINEEYINVNTLSDIHLLDTSKLLISLDGNGFTIFDKLTQKFEDPINLSNGLPNRFVGTILEDNENNIWIGSQGGGLIKFRDKGIKLLDDTFGLLSNNVLSISSSNDKIYVATSLGLNSIQDDKVVDTIYDIGSVAYVTTNNEEVFFSNFSSVVEFSDDEKLKFYNDENGFFSFLFKNDETTMLFDFYDISLKIIENDTIYVLNNKEDFLPLPYIRDVISLENHVVYITRTGVFEIKDKKVSKLQFNQHPIDVRTIDIIDENSFLVGDANFIYHIDYIDGNYNIVSIPIDRFNLPNDYVAFEVMNEYLWIGGEDFMNKIELDALFSKDSNTTKSYKIDKSLFGGIKRVANLGVCNLIHTYDDQLVGRASNGLYMFDEAAFQFHSKPPKINLSKIELFAEELNDSIYKNSTKEVILPYDNNYLTFHCEAISFTYPDDIQFKYRLNGLREGNEWSIPTSDNKMVFSYLPPGDYAFEFTADNGNGVWQDNSFVYPFKIKAPFWRLPWFWVTTILGASGLLLLYMQNRNKEKAKLAQQFSQGLITAQEEERTRISKDLHDSVGQQLTLIKKKAQNLDQEELSKMSNDALEEVRSISRDLYPATLRQLGFTQSVEQLVNDLDEGVDMFFTVEVDNIDNELNSEESLNFYRFIQESLSNVLKHSKAKAVSVIITKKPQVIEAMISDNGIGFNNVVVKNSLGLKTMSERIKMMNGTFSIKSKISKGTTINAQIPI